MSLPGPAPREGRGRVVMLVDNAVRGDSRVQKQARSAAERGWDVVLLGRSPDREAHSWKIGDAQVRLLPLPMPLGRRRYEYRRAPLRSPLAYPVGPVMAYMQQKSRARQVELATRRAVLHAGGSAGEGIGLGARIGLAWWQLARVAARLRRGWVNLRVGRTKALTARRRSLRSPIDRFSTAFWRITMGHRAWRRLEPGLWDYELAFGPRIDKLKPDLIHANDFRMTGVGARATMRARARGRDVKLVWDAHEYLPGTFTDNKHPRWHMSHLAYEREYVPYADAVVTVSETMAGLLTQRFGLTTRPSVVLNAPTAGIDGGDPDTRGVRELCGIGPETPLLVYSGLAAAQRGLDVMIDGLPALPGAHVVIVTAHQGTYVPELLRRASELGVAHRVHVLPNVPVDSVCRYLSSADVGVIPILHWPNHEIALITKFFEYSHARLPIVVSDVKTMADQTRATGQGEVFRAGDTADYVRAVQAVLADPDRYRGAYDKPGLLEAWVWESQADVLDRVYGELVAPTPGSVKVPPSGSVDAVRGPV